MGGGGTIELESPETVLEISSIGESERFWDLDNEAAFDEFESLRVVLCVFKLVLRAGYFAEDLYTGFGRVSDDGEERETDAQRNSKRQRVEDCGGENEEHESKFRPATDVNEEFDVVRGFLDKGISDNGYHG